MTREERIGTTQLANAVSALVMDAKEPFIVPDVTPRGESSSAVFHIVRDMVDAGELVLSSSGYWRVEPTS